MAIVDEVAAALRAAGAEVRTSDAGIPLEWLLERRGRVALLHGDPNALLGVLDRDLGVVPGFVPAMLLVGPRAHVAIADTHADEAARRAVLWHRKTADGPEPCVVCEDDAYRHGWGCAGCFARMCMACTSRVAKPDPADGAKVVQCPVCRRTALALQSIVLRHSRRPPLRVAEALRKAVAAFAPERPDVMVVDHHRGVLELLKEPDEVGERVEKGGIMAVGDLSDPWGHVNRGRACAFVVDDSGGAYRLDEGFECAVACFWTP